MKNPSRITEQENRLYLEVNQLQSKLALTPSSFLSQFVFVFVQTYKDIVNLFQRKEQSHLSKNAETKLAIHKLKRQKAFLLFLSRSPYMWAIRFINFFSRGNNRSIPSDVSKNNFIYIFAATPYSRTQSRSVRITRQLSKKKKCIYIESIFDEQKKPGFRIISQEKNLTVVRISARESLHIGYQSPTFENKKILQQSIRFLISSFPNSAITYYLHHPFWYPLLPKKVQVLWYDKSIDFAHFHNVTTQLILIERKIIRLAQKITTPNSYFFPKKKNIKIIANSGDSKIFKSTSKSIDTCSVGLCWIKKPVVGYIGTLDERIDEGLLGRLAETFPTLSFVLVGNTDYRPVIDVAEKHKNIFPVGEKEYGELPKYLQSFDILMIPYKQIKNAVMAHPELPLYLISGKPLVATAAVDMARYKKCIYLPASQSDWSRQLSEAINEKKRSKKRYMRIKLAHRNF